MRIETRTGDTPQNRRKRQRTHPPDLLLTTPESLALLLSYEDAAGFFGQLRCVVLDELHALAESKRGALFSLAAGAPAVRLAPRARFVGLSATVAMPALLQRYLSPRPDEVDGRPGRCRGRARGRLAAARGRDALGRPHGELRRARRLPA